MINNEYGYEQDEAVPAVPFEYPDDISSEGFEWDATAIQKVLRHITSARPNAWRARLAAYAHAFHVDGFETESGTVERARISRKTLRRTQAQIKTVPPLAE